MDSRTITLIASIAVIGLVAVGVGYAYTAITVNDNNSATSNYVTLSQTSYSYGTTDMYFDTYTTSTGSNYILTSSDDVKAAQITGIGSGTTTSAYFGEQIGSSDTLTARTTGTVSADPYKTTLSATGFTSYNGGYWTYILVFAPATGTVQYATWDGNAASWTYYGNDGTSAKSDGIYLADSVEYTVSLYFGGLGIEQSDASYTASSTTAPGATQITSGTIKFTATFHAAS